MTAAYRAIGKWAAGARSLIDAAVGRSRRSPFAPREAACPDDPGDAAVPSTQQPDSANTHTAGETLVNVLDAIDDGIALFSPDGKLIAWNRAYASMWNDWGLRLSEHVTGRMLSKHLEGSGDVLLDDQPVSIATMVETFAQSEDRTQVVSMEQQFRSGQWHRIKLSHHPDGSVVVVRSDISTLKRYGQAVQDLILRNACLAGAFNSTSVGVLIVDARAFDMPIIMANSAFLSITGYSESEVLGRNCRFLQGAGTDRATVKTLGQAILERQSVTAEILNYRRDGSDLWIELSLSPIFDDQGALTHYVGMQLDITQRRAAEAAHRQAQKMEALGQLTVGLAHEFNNLLNALCGGAEQLCDRLPESEDTGQTARLILAAAQRAAELTQDLLSFTQQRRLRPDLLDLKAVVAGMTNLLTRSLGPKIVIEQDFAPNLWAVYVDRAQMETSLVNLALNAREAMAAGGILRIGGRNLPMLDDAGSGQVEISVTDTGCGMTEEVRARACEPFFTTKEVGEGSGLGLSMVHGFVEQSGGRLSVQSRHGLGTTILILLPRAQAITQAWASRIEMPALPTGSERILITDDDPLVRRVLVRLLTSLHYRVVEAQNADEAFAVLANSEPIDLLLTDIVMPGRRDGYQLAQEAALRYPKLKILLMTGNAAAQSAGLTSQSGFSQLPKPFSNASVAALLRAALDDASSLPDREEPEA